MPSDVNRAAASCSPSETDVSRTNQAASEGPETTHGRGCRQTRAASGREAASITSSSTVVAVTAGPAPGPLKNSPSADGVASATAFCTPSTRDSGLAPSTNAGPAYAVTAAPFHEADTTDRMAPPNVAA